MAAETNCAACGTPLVRDASFCSACGRPVTPATNVATDWEMPPAGRRSRRKLLAFGLAGLLVVALGAGGLFVLANRPASGTFHYQGVFEEAGELPQSATGVLLADGRCLLEYIEQGPAARPSEVWIFEPKSRSLRHLEGAAGNRLFSVGFATPDGGAVFISMEVGGRTITSAKFDPRSETFGDGPALALQQSFPEVVTLSDGRVALLADFDSAEVQLYDPETSSFRKAGRLTAERMFPATALLPGDRILVAGGMSMSSSLTADEQTAEIFDPATGRSTATGDLTTSRRGPEALALADGRVLVLGGVANGAGADRAELFDAKTGRFTETSRMTREVDGVAMAPLRDGRVLVVDDGPGANAQLFDPRDGTFSSAGTVPLFEVPRDALEDGETTPYYMRPQLLALRDGRVLVISGNKLFIYH